jgi:DNA polymerase III sliding clamp (beta) subunit (PCNA family)
VSGEGSLTGGELTLSAASEDMGQAVERVPASVGDDQSGEEFVAAFNPQYLTSAVAAAGTEDVLFKFNDPLKPAMVFPDGSPEGSPSVQLLLMPMRDPARQEKEEKQPAKKEDSKPQETASEPEPVGAGSKG